MKQFLFLELSMFNFPISLDYKNRFNPIRPGLFSHSPGPGGSKAQMPKIEVNIHQLK